VIFEVLIGIGAYAVHYYTKARLGMLRHVVYLNGKWERAYPIESIKMIIIVILLLACLWLAFKVRRMTFLGKVQKMGILASILLNGWALYFIVIYNPVSNKTYYILSMCFVLLTIFQNMTLYFIMKLKQA
jgi:hypothetical protein